VAALNREMKDPEISPDGLRQMLLTERVMLGMTSLVAAALALFFLPAWASGIAIALCVAHIVGLPMVSLVSFGILLSLVCGALIGVVQWQEIASLSLAMLAFRFPVAFATALEPTREEGILTEFLRSTLLMLSSAALVLPLLFFTPGVAIVVASFFINACKRMEARQTGYTLYVGLSGVVSLMATLAQTWAFGVSAVFVGLVGVVFSFGVITLHGAMWHPDGSGPRKHYRRRRRLLKRRAKQMSPDLAAPIV